MKVESRVESRGSRAETNAWRCWPLTLDLRPSTSSSSCRESLLHLGNNARAGFFRRLTRVVDDDGAERNHQWCGGALTIAMVACRQVFIHALVGAALRALLQ